MADEAIDASRALEAWFAENVAGRRAAARLRAHLRRALEPDLRGHRRRRACAGRCAARRSASASPRPTTWAASTGSSPRSQRHRRPGAARSSASARTSPSTARPSTSWSSSRARSCARAPRPRRASTRPSGAAIGERVVDTLVAIHGDRPRPGRARRPGPKAGLRRPPAPPLARPVGEVARPREVPLVDDVHRRLSRRGSPSRARRRSSTATTGSTT